MVEGARKPKAICPQSAGSARPRASRRCRGRRGRSVRRRVPRCEAIVETELDSHQDRTANAGRASVLGEDVAAVTTAISSEPFHLKVTKSRSRALRDPVPLGLCAPLSPARSTNKAKQDRHGRRAVPPILPSARRANAQLLLLTCRSTKSAPPHADRADALMVAQGRAFLRRAERNALAKGQRPTAPR